MVSQNWQSGESLAQKFSQFLIFLGAQGFCHRRQSLTRLEPVFKIAVVFEIILQINKIEHLRARFPHPQVF